MKTITITLNKEQERLLLDRVVRSTWRLTDKDITHLKRNYKNPSEWTKGCVASFTNIKFFLASLLNNFFKSNVCIYSPINLQQIFPYQTVQVIHIVQLSVLHSVDLNL